jgi:hypothetical protein
VLLSAWGRTYFFTVRPQDLAGHLLRVRVVDPVLDAAECVAVEFSDAVGEDHRIRVAATMLSEDLPAGRAAWAILAFVALAVRAAVLLVCVGAQ